MITLKYIPHTEGDIKSLLGFLGHYCSSIQDFCQLAKPLLNCCKSKLKLVKIKPKTKEATVKAQLGRKNSCAVAVIIITGITLGKGLWSAKTF